MNETAALITPDTVEEPLFPPEEFMRYMMAFEEHHSIFYHFWKLGRPIFNSCIPTAMIKFDENGQNIQFHFNPDMWKRMNETQRMFVIAHECLHVILSHNIRMLPMIKNVKENKDKNTFGSNMIEARRINVAMDLVVNEMLVSKFGFSKNEVDPKSTYCWIDNIFKDDEHKDLLRNKSFEFYYNRLTECDNKNMLPQIVDGHEFITEEQLRNILGDLFEDMSSEEIDMFIKTLKSTQSMSSSGSNLIEEIIKERKVKKKKKWETVIVNWARKKLTAKEEEMEHWLTTPKRMKVINDSSLSSVMGGEMFLPNSEIMPKEYREKCMIDVVFFLDTSGSCWGLKDRFFYAAETLPEETFRIHLYCFDTNIYPTSLASRKVNGGGGTSFGILESFIQQSIRKGEMTNYPDAVFVITDGYGDIISPEIPKNWYWFLTDGGSKECIDKKCHTFNLSDFE